MVKNIQSKFAVCSIRIAWPQQQLKVQTIHFFVLNVFTVLMNTASSSTASASSLLTESVLPSDQYVVEIDGKRKCSLCDVEFTSAMCEMSHIKV